jgi:hypothetical protein
MNRRTRSDGYSRMIPTSLHRPRARGFAYGMFRYAAAWALLLGACASLSCGKSPTGPSSTLTVRTVSPNSGTTLGGTTVTIGGTQFAAGATVTIGGAPATNVTVQSDTTLTATTPQHATGAADVVVTIGTKSGSLPGGFTFSAPGRTDNAPPAIASIAARGTRANEPVQFADLDETINVTANVTDAETSPDQLEYQWSAPLGTFSGSGANQRWQAPHDAGTPFNVDLTLTVTEHYQTTDDSGLPVTRDNKTTATTTVSLHNSAKEVGDIAVLYLEDFSAQSQSPDQMLRNFMQCAGRSAERDDIVDNQATRSIKRHTIGSATVKLNFGGNCSFTGQDGGFRARTGDACIAVPADWRSIVTKASSGGPAVGSCEHSSGTDRLTGFYQNNRWWLCDSDFDGTHRVEGSSSCTP